MFTTDVFAQFERDPRWGGFGYLFERDRTLTCTDPGARRDPARVAVADARIVAEANARGWTAEELFEWVNSREGRFFADRALGWGDVDRAVRDHFRKIRW